MLAGAELAQSEDPSLEVVAIGSGFTSEAKTKLTVLEAADSGQAHKKMDALLLSGELSAAVTMH
jgi:hypothetical protein